jgi:hypothetical protein
LTCAAGEGADFVAKLVSEKGNVALLEGEPGGSTAADRKNGFKETIAKYPNIHLVASLNGHWTLPDGVEATEALIAEHWRPAGQVTGKERRRNGRMEEWKDGTDASDPHSSNLPLFHSSIAPTQRKRLGPGPRE